MLLQEELVAMVAAEEKRLSVGSEEFMQCHNEIMQLIEDVRQEGGKWNGADRADDNVKRSIQSDRYFL